MSEKDDRPLDINDIVEGGWEKKVAPPKADARPSGLPPAGYKQQAADNPPKEKPNG